MILIYSEKLNPRIEYIFRLIFTTILQNEVSFTTKSNKFLKSTSPKINYSYERFGSEFYIKPHRLMHCRALIQPDIQPVWYNGEKYFFESSGDSVFPFDPFAASFYLVSRYEEYLEFDKDQYKRFPADECLLQKYNLLKKPVVNIWSGMIASRLRKLYPELVFPRPQFRFLPTVDIDNAWAFAHKGMVRTFGAVAKSAVKGNFGEISKRLKVRIGNAKDPYDTYDFIDEVFKGNEKEAIFFILLGSYKRYDKNISWKNNHLQKLVRRLAQKYEIGVHPSFSSSKKKNRKKVEEEKKRLEQITGKKVSISRQHFLRLRFPRTYRTILKAGIETDHSMGYPSHPGFRAGICTPYPFYDLKKESVTGLTIVPFQVMDVSLTVYKKMVPEEALEEIYELMQEVRNVGGTFCYIWHNETLNDEGDWKGYKEVFRKMNESGFDWMNGRE